MARPPQPVISAMRLGGNALAAVSVIVLLIYAKEPEPGTKNLFLDATGPEIEYTGAYTAVVALAFTGIAIAVLGLVFRFLPKSEAQIRAEVDQEIASRPRNDWADRNPERPYAP